MRRSLMILLLLCVSGTALAQEAPAAATAETGAVAADATPVAEAPADAAPVDEAGQVPAEPAPAAAAAAETTPANGLVAPPAEGMGQVVFFRAKKFTGSAVRFKVREGTAELGKLGSGSYFVVPTTPGTHEYTVHSEAKDVLALEIDAGETYYVEGSVSMGFMVARPNLSPSDEAAFAAASAKLKKVR